MDSFSDLYALLDVFRNKHGCMDTFVIYTGYTEEEAEPQVHCLMARFPNIIMKFGRYVPYQTSHMDELLGVVLASPNQYAVKIS